MFVDDAIAPLLYAWWVPALGVLAIALAGLLLWFALRPPKKRHPRQSAEQAAFSRTTARSRLDEEYARFESGEIDLRTFHLHVAAIVREFGSARMGRDLTAMTRAEVEEAYPRGGVGALLKRCEQPSFSRDSRAEARATFTQVIEVIDRW